MCLERPILKYGLSFDVRCIKIKFRVWKEFKENLQSGLNCGASVVPDYNSRLVLIDSPTLECRCSFYSTLFIQDILVVRLDCFDILTLTSNSILVPYK